MFTVKLSQPIVDCEDLYITTSFSLEKSTREIFSGMVYKHVHRCGHPNAVSGWGQ